MTTAIRFPAKMILVHVRTRLTYLVSCSRCFWCFAVFCRTERTHIWRALCWIPFHSFLQSSEAKFSILKKRNKNKTCVCVLLSTGYFSCQSQQELTVKRIRVGDAKHGQIHFINHKLACLPALGNSHNNIILFASSWKKKSHLSHNWRAPCENAPLIFAHFESSSKLLQATFV